MDCVICRYGELALKGKNRGIFEARLVSNIKDCLKQNNIGSEVLKVRGRVFVYTKDKVALTHLKNVFGLVSISPAVVVDNDIENIKSAAADYISNLDVNSLNTFRITTRRPNKGFPKASNEMDIILGDLISEKFKFKVKLTDPDLNLGVEIHERTYIFHEKIPCFGGLPLGISGKVACLLRNNADVAAAWLMLRRGCEAFMILFNDVDIDVLKKYSYGINISSINTEEIEKLDYIVEEKGGKAIVAGDTLAEFSEQDYKNIKTPILTPLIGYDEKQIVDLLERII